MSTTTQCIDGAGGDKSGGVAALQESFSCTIGVDFSQRRQTGLLCRVAPICSLLEIKETRRGRAVKRWNRHEAKQSMAIEGSSNVVSTNDEMELYLLCSL
ncbi:hypothetical protein AXF42_Ash012682 [Apostasia shenzhenica]|uniref:Uncharacterized protein n=1 Tax=Apostasia shenzhenica TaxID=1088818 RepID=A0A2H9ZTD6_9ASPA|nr:hypothetical protein AXF42_Ash012682 [Apostasia shenzhenica]